jgi:hypothetical protein
MLDAIREALQETNNGPSWLALAVVLLGIASRVARAARQSAVRQGERIGQLEKRADSERLRRQQVEAHLTGLGIRLPWWPADGRPAPTYEPYSGPGPWPQDGVPLPYDDEDQDEGDPPTAEGLRIPPLPDWPRHRRSTPA